MHGPRHRARRLPAVAAAAAAAFALISAGGTTEALAAKRCKPVTNAQLGVKDIRAAGAPCRTARVVARTFTNEQERRTLDQAGRAWFCRITRHATGTDPGSYPHTHVRCARRSARVTFKLHS